MRDCDFTSPTSYNDRMKPSPMEEAARKVAERLRENGHIAYFAGGCVRDMVRGLAPKDYDIATDARPEVVQKTFSTDLRGRRAFWRDYCAGKRFPLRGRNISFRWGLYRRTAP